MKKTRNTVQRMKILEYLKEAKNHASAEQVYKEVSKEIPTITLATVYRNLNHLAENGQITRFRASNGYRFEATVKNHQHFICKKCGEIKDLFQDKLTEHALNNVKPEGDNVEYVNIMFYGTCKKCR
ncbi:transcriptional repressor [Candidatus Woesearchaeota archaeon]|nr:transcriptional repressor [Candidatus Woesearchaeota archaeon]